MKNIISAFVCLAILAGCFFGGYIYAKNTIEPEIQTEVVEKEKIVEIPGEVQKRVVTKDEVESKIMEIGELAAFSGEYTVTKEVDESRYVLDQAVWGTKNRIQLTASGIVKVGYDLNDIVVKVDTDTIYISYPHAKLLDNYVVWDTVECKENNTMLNPIEFSQYQEIVSDMEAEGLADVEAKGIYDQADENLQHILNAFLAEFVDYEIVYM